MFFTSGLCVNAFILSIDTLHRFALHRYLKHSVQFSSVPQSCPTLWDPMNHSTPGLPVHLQLPEFTQTHVHQISDAIQPSHPLRPLLLLPPIPPSIRVFSRYLVISENNLHAWQLTHHFSKVFSK